MSEKSYWSGVIKELKNEISKQESKKKDLEDNIEKLEKKIKDWNDYVDKLEDLSGNLPGIASNLSSCRSTLLNGGYCVNGETLDNGDLDKIADKINDSVDSLTNVISSTNDRIDEFQKQLDNLKKDLEDVESYIEGLKSDLREAYASYNSASS